MNTHLGICLLCGYTTSVVSYHGRKCPIHRTELKVVHQKYTKLINKANITGEERLKRLHKLPKHLWTV